MKQADFNLKTFFTFFLANVIFAVSLFSQQRIPVKVNWQGEMIEPTGEYCINVSEEGQLTVLLTVFFHGPPSNLANHPDLYVYAKLPGKAVGEYFFVHEDLEPVNFGPPEGKLSPECPSYMMLAKAYFTSDASSFCGTEDLTCVTVDWQLVTPNLEGAGFCPYPIADNPGLFPPGCVDISSDYAQHWSEQKAVCCSGVQGPPPITFCNTTGPNTGPNPPSPGDPPGGGPTVTEGPHLCADEEGNGEIQLVSNQGSSTQNETLRGLERGEYAIRENSISIFPNPVYSTVTVDFALENAGEVTFEWMDLNGRTVTSVEKYFTSEGTYRENFQTDDWATGTYLLRMSTATGSRVFKINKMNR